MSDELFLSIRVLKTSFTFTSQLVSGGSSLEAIFYQRSSCYRMVDDILEPGPSLRGCTRGESRCIISGARWLR